MFGFYDFVGVWYKAEEKESFNKLSTMAYENSTAAVYNLS